MKKVLFAIAAMATCMTASAQLWVSGGLNFGSQSYWNVDDSQTSWGISPAIGYALDDALEVGLEFGISGTSQKDDSSLNFSIAPFARYTFLSEGDFSMFIQGKVGYNYGNVKTSVSTTTSGVTTTTTTERKTWGFDIDIEPGIKYAFTDNFAMAATLGGLYFKHNDPEKASAFGGTTQNGFGLSFSTNLKLSLVYTF